jgi:hypothetical protein
VRGIPVAADHRVLDRRGRRINQLASKQVSWLAVGSRGVGRRPDLIVPGDDVSLVVESTTDVGDHWWALRLPGELVLAHPLHADRCSHRLREHRRISGAIVSTIVAVAAGPFLVHKVNLLLIHAKEGRHGVAQKVDTLRVAVNRGPVEPHIGDSARGSDGRMGLRCVLVPRLDRLSRRAERALDIAVVSHLDVDSRLLLDEVEILAGIR